MDYETFKAINDACLVFDGRLVIDTKFRTNDVSIRAAGPLTKYSRRYCVDEWTHSNFNSKEIGFELAASMLNLFDPTRKTFSKPPEGTDRLIPMYKGCKIKGMSMDFCHTWIRSLVFLQLYNKGRSISPKMPSDGSEVLKAPYIVSGERQVAIKAYAVDFC